MTHFSDSEATKLCERVLRVNVQGDESWWQFFKNRYIFYQTCRSRSLSVPLAKVTYLFCLKVNRTIAHPPTHKKKWISRWQLDRRPLTFVPFCQPASQPLSVSSLETTEHLVSEKQRKWQSRVTPFPPLIRHCCLFSVAFPNSCLLCWCRGFFLYWWIGAACSPALAVMTSKSAGLSVRCTSPWVWLPAEERALCQPVQQQQQKKKSITRRPVFTEQFHPACVRGGLSSEPCLAFKCGKSAQSPPLTRKSGAIIELVQP